MLDPEIRSLMQAYKFFKDGHLPAPGGVLDQSRLFLRLIGVIDSERGAIEEEREAARRRRRQLRD